ncbi:MAG: hypothetical protein ABIL68_11070 [bacterium]
MKMRATIIFMGIILLFGCGSKPKVWVGTYALEITEETRETYDMFAEMNMQWPEITLNADGTFTILKTEGRAKITGTYKVDGKTLTVMAARVDGRPPEGKYATPYTAEFRDDFKTLMLEGPDSESWVQKEVNDAFLKLHVEK